MKELIKNQIALICGFISSQLVDVDQGILFWQTTNERKREGQGGIQTGLRVEEKAYTVRGVCGAVTVKGMEMGSRKGAGNLEMTVACVLQTDT